MPVSTVGIYIPGGTAPLFSTLLMLGVPAIIAGCEEIVVCSPPDKNGKISPATGYVAKLLGLEKVFKLGGAQAIAAMAYGTESVPKVYKIYGPGNQYVQCAKRMVRDDGIEIDMIAGPSEVAVIADGYCTANIVAADLLAQAEHGADSQVLFVTDKEDLMLEVIEETENQLESLPRKDAASESIAKSSFVLVDSIQKALDLVNEYAPEHLILAVEDVEKWADSVKNAGSVFLGAFSPESAGDYASGTNHTLPTNGFARVTAGVSLDSFVKKITFQKITEDGLARLSPVIQEMAKAEGLEAHRRSVSARYKGKV